MSNKDNTNNNNKDHSSQRVVRSDGRNSSGARGSTRKRNTLDLDFEFDFMKKEQEKFKTYGLFPEFSPMNDHTTAEAAVPAKADRDTQVKKAADKADNRKTVVNKDNTRVIRKDAGDVSVKAAPVKSERFVNKQTITKPVEEDISIAPDKQNSKDSRKTITRTDEEVSRKTITKAEAADNIKPSEKKVKAAVKGPEKKDKAAVKSPEKKEKAAAKSPEKKAAAAVKSPEKKEKAVTKNTEKKDAAAAKSAEAASKKTQTGQKKQNSGANNTNKNKKTNKNKNTNKNTKKGASKTVKSATRKKTGAGAASGAKQDTAKKSTAKKPVKAPDQKPAAKKPSGTDTPQNKKPVKKKRKPRNKFLWFFRCLIITLISFAILGGIAAGAYTAYIVSHAEPIHPEKIYDTLPVTSHIYDDKGKLIDDIYYSENREITTYDELPDNLKNAFIAIEDKTFWTHKGFNFRRIIGAILERFQGSSSISGTSTITQQLARNVFLPEEKSVRSIKRKITEMYYAYEIEEVLSKEEILTAYLNTIYLGYGCYGVDTAAKIYFASDIQDLSLEQCAALAALPQAPGMYALLVSEPGDYTTEIKNGMYANDVSESRRNLVLQLMQEQGYITAEQREAATKPLADFIKPGSTAGITSTSAFKDYLIETVKHDLMAQYGMTEDQAVDVIYTKGLNIYSTLDSQAQSVITKQFKDNDNFPKTAKKGVKPEAAMVITEVGTGKIKAMVGSRNADGQMLFNRATNPRQPGSSIKPLTVYAAALQKSYEFNKKGKTFKFTKTGYDKQGTNGWGDYITVSSLVVDEKMTVKGKTWPLNVTRTYSGANTFRTAIQKSINTCAVKILAQVGIDYSMNMLQKFGITTAVDDTSQSINDLNLAALGLGAMSEGISPLEMALAYAAFPNGGVRNTGICYTRVEDSDGKVILEGKSDTVKVMNEGVAWIMTNVLQSVVTNGIGSPAAVSGERVGGKTGTTDSRYDIWFAGFTPKYSAALWIGTDENVEMDSYSEKAAALWGKIMSKVKRGKGGEYRNMPKNVFRAWDGEFYTNGTAPPEPPPEPEEEEEGEEGADKDKSKEGAANSKPADKSKESSSDSKKPDKKD